MFMDDMVGLSVIQTIRVIFKGRCPFREGWELALYLKGIEIPVILLLLLISYSSLFLVQATNDYNGANAEIQIAHTTNKFTSNTFHQRSIMPEETAPSKNQTGIIEPPLNRTAHPTNGEIIQPSNDMNKTILKAYDILFMVINHKNKQKNPIKLRTEQQDSGEPYYAPGIEPPNSIPRPNPKPNEPNLKIPNSIDNALDAISQGK
jgi:hypothetical protein